MFSSGTDEWSTPNDFFEKLDKEFHFTLDVCATKENAKCRRFFTKKENGLLQDWGEEICWMNPPYGRAIVDWVRKAYEEAQNGSTVVALLPARTDTRWFHGYIYGGHEIRFVQGRLKFGGCKNSAPFPSMIVIFRTGGNR